MSWFTGESAGRFSLRPRSGLFRSASSGCAGLGAITNCNLHIFLAVQAGFPRNCQSKSPHPIRAVRRHRILQPEAVRIEFNCSSAVSPKSPPCEQLLFGCLNADFSFQFLPANCSKGAAPILLLTVAGHCGVRISSEASSHHDGHWQQQSFAAVRAWFRGLEFPAPRRPRV